MKLSRFEILKVTIVKIVNVLKFNWLFSRLDLDWLERLDFVNEPAAVAPDIAAKYGDAELKTNNKGEVIKEVNESEDKAQDDFKRELLFYRQAQASVLEALPKLNKAGKNKNR